MSDNSEFRKLRVQKVQNSEFSKFSYDQCRHKLRLEQTIRLDDPVKLVKISGTFTIWAAGLAIAVAAFAVEWLKILCICDIFKPLKTWCHGRSQTLPV